MDSQPSRSSGRFETSPTTINNTPFLTKSISDANSSSSSPHSQSLASILNNPHAGKSDGFWWWSTSSSIPTPDFLPLSTLPKPGSDTRVPDFQSYLSSISDPYARFHDIQQHARFESLEDQDEQNALVACLKEVPALYFKEDFKLEDGATFKAACPFRTIAENLVTQEKLSQYLDVVEFHLVREISLRSNSFFEAQGQLEDLNSKIVEGCDRIRELKETIRLLDDDLVGSARKVHELNVQRSDLIAHQDKLKLILYVNHAISTLKLSLNDIFIALIPKKYGAEELKGFRPKSLIVGVYKIISKLIAERLKTVMRGLVDDRKMTFLQCRQIMDATLLANGLVDSRVKQKTPRILCKLDIVKAYGLVHRAFLLEILRDMCFIHIQCEILPNHKRKYRDKVSLCHPFYLYQPWRVNYMIRKANAYGWMKGFCVQTIRGNEWNLLTSSMQMIL